MCTHLHVSGGQRNSLRCYSSGTIPSVLFCFEIEFLTSLELTKKAGFAGQWAQHPLVSISQGHHHAWYFFFLKNRALGTGSHWAALAGPELWPRGIFISNIVRVVQEFRYVSSVEGHISCLGGRFRILFYLRREDWMRQKRSRKRGGDVSGSRVLLPESVLNWALAGELCLMVLQVSSWFSPWKIMTPKEAHWVALVPKRQGSKRGWLVRRKEIIRMRGRGRAVGGWCDQSISCICTKML